MPDAHHYRDAAHHLRRLAPELHDEAAAVRQATEPTTFSGGPLTAVLQDAVAVSGRSVERAVGELVHLATICDRRAEVCDGFLAELRRHARLVDELSRWIPVPLPPAGWVEVGVELAVRLSAG